MSIDLVERIAGAALEPTLARTWLPVCTSAELVAGAAPLATRLAGVPLVLWRSRDGSAHGWLDRCPHRGAALSLGRAVDEGIACPYHGWRFAPDGQCVHWPAHPGEAPPAIARATGFPSAEHHGLVWLRLGDDGAAREILPPEWPAYAAAGAGCVIDGPHDVAAGAPRVIENFLDMAHFAFVHPGTLGDPARPDIADYDVAIDAAGIVATHCRAFQPQAAGLAREAVQSEYTYRVSHPLAASFSKLEGTPDAFHTLIVASPLDATTTRIWKVIVVARDEPALLDAARSFSASAVAQDLPVVRSQQPRELPLDPRAESHQRADLLSAAYRRHLDALGWRWDVTPKQAIPTPGRR